MNVEDVSTGIVIIGRNEGERLVRCLHSVKSIGVPIVYVDSASDDGSAERVRQAGIDVVELDQSVRLTAARGRNAGFAYLKERYGRLRYVQFVDGDCQLHSGWIESAVALMKQHADWAAVCGQLRELRPQASIYNRLCDLEWDRPVGRTEHCGGIFMVRVEAFEAVGGFDAALAAGEEPELCRRLRRTGWEIHRVDAPMALHDADMHHFGQWWRRAVRSGHGYAEALRREGCRLSNPALKAVCSIGWWTAVVPCAAVIVMMVVGWAGSLILLLYFVQIFRMTVVQARRRPWSEALWYAGSCMAAKWPQGVGVLGCWAGGLAPADRKGMPRGRSAEHIGYSSGEIRNG